MTIDLQALAEDPSLFLFAIDGGAAHFQRMSRDGFHRSIFLDNRMVASDERMHLPLEAVRRYDWPAPSTRPVGLIFHIAQCGSTLLARALDMPTRNLVLREPAALRRLGVETAVSGLADDQLLRFTMSMLGKRWQSDAPVIVKANVPVNFVADKLVRLEGGAPAILLYFPISSYVAAVMRTEGHEKWVESIYGELRLDASPVARARPPRNTAQRAACLWFLQMQRFAVLLATFPNLRSLWAEHLFERPAETVHEAAGLFGMSLTKDEAREIASSELFATYSKNPALDYDLEVRAAREQEAKRRLAPQIAEALAWADAARKDAGLPDRLDRPMAGEAATLLS